MLDMSSVRQSFQFKKLWSNGGMGKTVYSR
jgi:hypothetical protein